MSAVESVVPSPDEEDGGSAEAEFLQSLPPRLQIVRARRELTRESLPRRGGSEDDPQLSAMTQRVWDAEKRTARALAEHYRALADLHEHDGVYEETTELDEVDTLRAALALRVTRNAAAWHLRDAYQAVRQFPRCLERLESGDLPSAWFQRMLKTARCLSDDSRRKLDIAISTWSSGVTAERFFTVMRALVQLLESRESTPDPVSALERRVDLVPGVVPGTGILQITGPIPEILAQWKKLDESARAVQAAQRAALRDGTPIPHDPDGIVQETGKSLPLAGLRFALMGTAEFDLEGVAVPAERFRLQVTVPALTLLGGSEEPGALDGTIPLPPSTARSLAGGTGTWFRVLTDPSSGAFLPLPADKYEPTTAMLEHLRLRNAQCAVPGCTRPTSWASECDHLEECLRGAPGVGGLTEIENLHLLCWQHHLDKTNGLLDPVRVPTGSTEPGRTRWRIGPQGDAVTVIDDLDVASTRMAEDLQQVWVAFLRGHRVDAAAAGRTSPVQEPPPPDAPSAEGPPAGAPPADDRPPDVPPSPPSDPPEIPPGSWGTLGPPPF